MWPIPTHLFVCLCVRVFWVVCEDFTSLPRESNKMVLRLILLHWVLHGVALSRHTWQTLTQSRLHSSRISWDTWQVYPPQKVVTECKISLLYGGRALGLVPEAGSRMTPKYPPKRPCTLRAPRFEVVGNSWSISKRDYTSIILHIHSRWPLAIQLRSTCDFYTIACSLWTHVHTHEEAL